MKSGESKLGRVVGAMVSALELAGEIIEPRAAVQEDLGPWT